jgi:UDP-N-acetylglucosamine--N-acetylmuramyl-(pentapeptide) pyrophosphoryl-undecaprenol N-acetylglucosamine transferase
MRLPSLLVPYPFAADNHQFFNAQAFAETGAARLLEQKDATSEKVSALLIELIENSSAREAMQAALIKWHAPKAAEQIAEAILQAVTGRVSLAPRSGERAGVRGEINLKAVA